MTGFAYKFIMTINSFIKKTLNKINQTSDVSELKKIKYKINNLIHKHKTIKRPYFYAKTKPIVHYLITPVFGLLGGGLSIILINPVWLACIAVGCVVAAGITLNFSSKIFSKLANIVIDILNQKHNKNIEKLDLLNNKITEKLNNYEKPYLATVNNSELFMKARKQHEARKSLINSDALSQSAIEIDKKALKPNYNIAEDGEERTQ